MVYAAIGHCENVALAVRSSCDDKVEYAEVKNQLETDSGECYVMYM